MVIHKSAVDQQLLKMLVDRFPPVHQPISPLVYLGDSHIYKNRYTRRQLWGRKGERKAKEESKLSRGSTGGIVKAHRARQATEGAMNEMIERRNTDLEGMP